MKLLKLTKTYIYTKNDENKIFILLKPKIFKLQLKDKLKKALTILQRNKAKLAQIKMVLITGKLKFTNT